MEKILIAATLACLPGYRLVDWSNRIPHGVEFADVIVTVEPFYTRLQIYPVGHPENVERCCNLTGTGLGAVTVSAASTALLFAVGANSNPEDGFGNFTNAIQFTGAKTSVQFLEFTFTDTGVLSASNFALSTGGVSERFFRSGYFR